MILGDPISFKKDPGAVLDYVVDWSAWLPDGDTIDTSTFTVEDGITKASEAASDTTATVWLSGGEANQSYAVVNRITTLGGRTDERTITILVRER